MTHNLFKKLRFYYYIIFENIHINNYKKKYNLKL